MASTVTLEKMMRSPRTMTIQSGDDIDVGSPRTLRSPLLMKGRKVGGGGEDVVTDKCCGHKKCELVSYDKLPEFLKHNEFIVDYYRSEWPIKEALLSAFSIHNETINVWTHLIGFFVFLALTVCAATMVPMEYEASHNLATSTGLANITGNAMVLRSYYNADNGAVVVAMKVLRNVSVETDIAAAAAAALSAPGHRVARWPFYAYLCGAMFCLLMSSACHLLACHSEHASYVFLRLDYAGITGLIVTSFYPLVYYTFLCDPFYQALYLGFITASGAAAVAVSLLPVFERPELRWARAGLFACMGMSGLVPIVHKMLVFGARPEAVLTTGYEMAMGAFYLAGVVVYATRVPERWIPGRFDLAGHSHQLFHVLVIAGAYAHYLAGLVYLGWRDMDGC
ncbi:Heptahelical transmembrane protein 4 [Dichanthelium oligosanthes]|uniref:Heptahelical transmembrane protein 4 n=1 Tax=Dichanthelium oligosanthes TaxID=888268 RepID=A0A1E5UK36_9POAL|nr:Heptahelical transmembrane protein 4 [Dichanthelium oligosanthes]